MIAEKSKRPGVCYAVTDDGLELPVIDVTHDAFAIGPSPAELAEISAQSLRMLRQSIGVPVMLQKMATKGSILLREAFGKERFLGGMTTYLQKLGPANLGAAYANDVDRRVAASIGPLCMRLRLRDTARMLAARLAPALAAAPGAPLEMISIGGGPAPECWNALILLRQVAAASLEGRGIRIRSLDVDREGASFGARCVDALRAEGAPLHGLDVALAHVAYDWTDPGTLCGVTDALASAVAIGSTEGGLFEYGSDQEIVANLEALRAQTPPGFVMTGSVVRDEATADPSLAIMREIRGIPPRLLGLDRFAAVAAAAGWQVDQAIDGNPCYVVVALSKES